MKPGPYGRALGVVAIVATLALSAGLAVAQSPTMPPVTRPSEPGGAKPLPVTRPSRSGATRPATTTAALDPAVVRLLDRVTAAYTADRPLTITGTLVGTFDVAGRHRTYTLHVRGVTDGHGLYLHDAADTGLLINDGHDAYLYDQQRNTYAKLPATTQRSAAEAVEPSLVSVLLDENPALLLTLTTDPAALLTAASASPLKPATAPSTRPATGQADASAATGPAEAGLVVDRGGKTVTLWIDPATGEIRRSQLDYTPAFSARHTHSVVSARAELTYDVPDHARPTTRFAWQPPVTATEFTLESELLQSGPASAPASQP